MDSLITVATRFMKNSSKYYNFFLTDENNNSKMIGDYREITKKFKFSNIEKKTFYITNIVISITDNEKFKSLVYGSDLELQNGIRLCIKGLLYERNIIENNIFTNEDWLKYNCSVEQFTFGTTTTLRVTFNFHKDTDSFIRLLPSESFVCYLKDNFTSLLSHTINITGHYGEK